MTPINVPRKVAPPITYHHKRGEGRYILPRTALQPGAITRRDFLRFMSHTRQGLPCQCNGTPHYCWDWLGRPGADGYGKFPWRGHTYGAHRFAYIVLKGAIPDDLVPDHLCRHPLCCNPACLDIVSQRINNLRGDGPCAQLARQTHCKHGHLLEGKNLLPWAVKRGRRVCRTCTHIAKRNYLARKGLL
jgi:hypothetical protein